VEGGTEGSTEAAPLPRCFTPLGGLDFTFLFLANSDDVGHLSQDKDLEHQPSAIDTSVSEKDSAMF